MTAHHPRVGVLHIVSICSSFLCTGHLESLEVLFGTPSAVLIFSAAEYQLMMSIQHFIISTMGRIRASRVKSGGRSPIGTK